MNWRKDLTPGGIHFGRVLFLTPTERTDLVDRMSALLDLATDRFLLLRLDPRRNKYLP